MGEDCCEGEVGEGLRSDLEFHSYFLISGFGFVDVVSAV